METTNDINIKPTLALNASLLAVQAEIGIIQKDGENPHFHSKYATLDNIWATVRPALTKAGLIVTNCIWGDKLVTAIVHAKSGERIESEFPIQPGLTAQMIGSALTYARRYNLCNLLQIVTGDDDDGEGAANPAPQPPAKPKAKPSEAAKKVAPLGPEYCPFGATVTKWCDMPTDRLQKALACKDAKMTDAHRNAIKAVLGQRVKDI